MADSIASDETATTPHAPVAVTDDSTSTEQTKKRKRKTIRFVVTGFGPFQGVPSNPTTVIANQLIDYLENNDNDHDHHVKHLAHVTTTTVLEVSVQAVQEFLNTTRFQQQDDKDAVVVLLHLGVNYKGAGFQLEKQAYNNAHFRVPDQQGFQPDKQLIAADLPLEHVLTTSLPVDVLCQQLQDDLKDVTVSVTVTDKINDNQTDTDYETNQETTTNDNDEKTQETATDDNDEKKQEETIDASAGTASTTKNNGDSEQSAYSISDGETTTQEPIKIMTSTDPGRFVCNYTYCFSLNKFCRNPADEAPTTDAANDDDEKYHEDNKDSTTTASKPTPTELPLAAGNTKTNAPTTTYNNKQMFSLFLHVPPGNVVPEDIQIRFVAQLMKRIEEYIQSL